MTEQQQHPISPPEHLVRKWTTWRNNEDAESFWRRIAMEAAQWGADQELEACVRHLDFKGHHSTVLDALRAARRPKPTPSLKQQGLEALEAHFAAIEAGGPAYRPAHKAIIRRALLSIPE